MHRTDRQFALLQILRDGQLHTAQALAERMGVSVRTIYRDMDRMQAAGVPVAGARGVGYRATGAITLPPLSLSEQELEALNLGIAIVSEAADPDLARAAARLGEKLDAVLPTTVMSDADAWKVVLSPLSDAARGLGVMSILRSAIKARQKVRLAYRETGGALVSSTVRPLQTDYWGRVWTLTAWCEDRADFREFRIDLIEQIDALPELFGDEPGKGMADYSARPGTYRNK